MVRNFFVLTFAAILSLSLISCSNNEKKAEETEAVSTGTGDDSGEDSNVSEKSLTFNPEGSDSGAISGLSTVNFDYDKSKVDAKYLELLQAHADYLVKNPSTKVMIEGHTDERGTPEYNLALGERRAIAVRRFLMANGAADGQIKVVSYGEERPAATGHTDDSWAKNRRVEIKYQSR